MPVGETRLGTVTDETPDKVRCWALILNSYSFIFATWILGIETEKGKGASINIIHILEFELLWKPVCANKLIPVLEIDHVKNPFIDRLFNRSNLIYSNSVSQEGNSLEIFLQVLTVRRYQPVCIRSLFQFPHIHDVSCSRSLKKDELIYQISQFTMFGKMRIPVAMTQGIIFIFSW